MNVYIDFDRTLFDTGAFFKDLENILELNGVPFNEFLKYAKEDEENGFNIFTILNVMKKDIKINSGIFEKINELFKNSETYIYDDAYDFIAKLKERGYKVFILTKGNNEYQLLKIQNTNLLNFVDGVLVTLKAKGELELDYQESIFIDDNPKELESIVKKNPKRIIRMKRDNAKYNDILSSEKIEEVNSLNNITI